MCVQKLELRTNSSSYLKLWRGKHSNLPKKTCRQKKNLAGRPETCLSVNDINSKRYKQPSEVEHTSCISSRNSPEKKIWTHLKTLFWEKGLRMKKVDIIMSARQMNVHYIYITYVRVTEIEVVMYLKMILPPQLVAVHSSQYLFH